MKYEMENAVKLNVPLTVELHTGKNWYDANNLKIAITGGIGSGKS